MHAGRVLSLKRKRSLERTRSRNRLQRGQTNGDLSQSGDDPLQDPNPNAPWYAIKWDERRRAFQSAKSTRGLSLFHMFALVALIGVGLMVGSLFVGPATGLLEIGVSALLFSLFCLIFVRCDAGDGDDKYVGVDPGSSLVIEEKVVGDEVKLSQDSDDGTRDSLLTRSNPRKIPSPLRVFGYEMNFSPILECSEPGSSVSSFLTRREGSEIPSRLANSSTTDSLSRVSSRGSGVSGGQGPGNGAGSPINEELEDFDYDQQLQLKLDFMGPQDSFQSFQSYNSFENDGNLDPGDPNPGDADLNLMSLSNSNLSAYSASFDTDDSITADLSVVTVVERNPSGSGSPKSNESTTPSP